VTRNREDNLLLLIKEKKKKTVQEVTTQKNIKTPENVVKNTKHVKTLHKKK